jgi:hypothetical protein
MNQVRIAPLLIGSLFLTVLVLFWMHVFSRLPGTQAVVQWGVGQPNPSRGGYQ